MDDGEERGESLTVDGRTAHDVFAVHHEIVWMTRNRTGSDCLGYLVTLMALARPLASAAYAFNECTVLRNGAR